MTINTAQYQLSHSKKPRGHGNWWFEIIYSSNRRESFQYSDLYSAALKAARKYARDSSYARVDQIIVQP